MSERPVLKRQSFQNRAVTEAELTEALVYIKTDRPEVLFKRGKKKGQVKHKAYVGQELARETLRIIANTALERWSDRKVILPQLVATVAHDAIPHYKGPTERETTLRYEAYKCATMKIMSIRRVWQMKLDAEKEAAGIAIPERPPQIEHPFDSRPKHAGQRRLFS